ncbi:MAG: PilT/PilU family type 4a pilus ATPase [Planctomycetaceae bacterium]|jgi:twitching motility protein PilT|nr:PilT/PilU family type 4a pilus ATPase [Planctomycetaceae bacterium]
MATSESPTTEAASGVRSAQGPRTPLEIDRLFEALVRLQGSDLHLKVGQPPFMRVKGALQPLKAPKLDDEQMERLCLPMLDDRQRKILEHDGGADFAHSAVVDGVKWRFRVNLLYQQGSLGLVARRVNNTIPDFKGLFLPPAIERLCQLDQGLVLLAGVTGSGKSTTIGSMLNYINQNYRKHILTLEDPIEFVYTDDKCLINQREIGTDVRNFEIGMKHAVREDPDIIVVGEMRDVETFKTAIHAAETGHLVFGTIHAANAPSTVTRILDLFPQEEHAAIRSAIAFNMKGIVAQKLLKSIKPGVSRVPIVELMFFDVLVKKYVLEGLDHQLADHIKKSFRDGMQDFTMSLKSLVDQGLIDRNAALEIAPSREALEMALKGIGVMGG